MSGRNDITVADIRNNLVVPFEYVDDKLKSLFSYFLHLAPSIDSASSAKISKEKAKIMWNRFIRTWDERELRRKIYSENSSYPEDSTLKEKYNLGDDSVVSRLSKAFVCIRKNDEEDIECLLRHIRNAIAHGHVYILPKSNRIYILFEDFNARGSKKASILFAQNDLKNLRDATRV